MSSMSRKKRKAQKDNIRGSFFFAYQSSEKSGNCDNADAIKNLAGYMGNKAVIWEKMKTNGKIINRQILEEINKAETFACDLTYLNANVFFELGYAIGKRKPLFIMLNTKVKNASINYSNINILKGIGYSDFSNADDLKTKLDNIDKNYVLLDQIKRLLKDQVNSIDVFYIKSSANSQAELDTLSYIKDSSYSQICDDKTEIAYQPLEWYLDSINKCKYLIVHLSGNDKTTASIDNCKNSLYAGLGLALDKKVLLVAPTPYYAPIDYNDILMEYNSSIDCIEKIESWLPKRKKQKPIITEYDKDINLLKLGIGYSVAEDERNELISYFVETYAYNSALRSRSSIFHGRKGAGKTAMYIKLLDDYTKYDNTYLISLKPESIELLENIKTIELYQDSANIKTLFYLIWRYVLYSKLILNLAEKIIEKNRFENSKEEQFILDYYDEHKADLNLNFLGTLRFLSNKYEKIGLSDYKIIEEFNKAILVPIVELIKQYFHNTKYYKLVFLADNLDKAWDANSSLIMQCEMIFSLLEVSGLIQQELLNRKNEKIETAIIMFLRSDIYKYILAQSREPDKINLITHEIEWSSCKELLKKVVEKRMIYILGIADEDVDQIWNDYFDFGEKSPFELVQQVTLPRPRDIIMFFGKMFESACNSSRKKINIQDFEFALDSYNDHLYQSIIAELNAEYPYIRNMLEELNSLASDKIEINHFRKTIALYELDSYEVKELISKLFSLGYLIAVNTETNKEYSIYDEVLMAEKGIRLLGIIKRKSIYIMLNPRYIKIKHKN